VEKTRNLMVGIGVGCLSLFIGYGVQGQTVSRGQLRKQVDRLFAKRIAASAPGAAVVVTREGKPIVRRCYGLADVEHGVPITPETRFNLASVAKQFVAFSILLLEKEGKLELDDDVRTFLPELPVYSPTVTVRHLLHHTSGIWEYSSILFPYCGYAGKDRVTLSAIMDVLAGQKKLLFEPGSQWSYCNTNYLLLAQVVEKATGVDFREWTRKNVFVPLEMRDSLFMKDGSQLMARAARCYRSVGGELVNGSGAWVDYVGPSYLFTTIDDMARWMDNFRTGKVGGAAVVEKMLEKATLSDGSESFYGFGLGVSRRHGRLTIGHAGQTGGFKTSMLYCPELRLGITVLANQGGIDADGLANRIFELYLGKAAPPPAEAAEKRAFLAFDPIAAAAFAGGYVVEGANLKIALNVDEGFLHGAIFGLGEDAFFPTGERTFSDRSGENLVEFSDISDGRAQAATVNVKGSIMTARRIALDDGELESRLPGYRGSYYCEVLGNGYAVLFDGGRLVVSHRRTGASPAQAIDADEFLRGLGFVKFTRDPNGEVVGFTLTPSDERVGFQGFEFVKVR